jgi:hypothetical protein
MGEIGPSPYGRTTEQFKVNKKLYSGRLPTNKAASEYGGVDGLIQPAPHDINDRNDQALMAIYNMDPAARVEETLPVLEPKLIRRYGE